MMSLYVLEMTLHDTVIILFVNLYDSIKCRNLN